MKKMTKKYLLSTLALSTAFCGLLGVNALTTKADGEVDPFANFRIADAEVRANDPSGIRFVTTVSADQLAAADSFGTVVIPKALLQDGDVANLVIENTDAANIPTEAWLNEEQTAYAGVIVGGNEEDGFVSLPATFYDDVLVAKAYAVVDGEVVYSTNYVEASIAQVAADALNAGDTTEFLQDIVDYVLDDELAFSVTSVETDIGADPVVATLETKGLNAKVDSSDKDVAYWADGKVHVGKKTGTAIITASIGDAVASIEVKVDERVYEYGVISDMKYGFDAFYHDTLKWGPAAMQDVGVAYEGRMTDYGVAKELTDAEYEALLAAGYKGAKASKSVWSTRAPIHSTANSSFGLNNGVVAQVNLGSQSFNKVISDIIDDASIDMNGAYVSVWVRSSVAVNYGFTYLSPMSEYGKYSGKHLGAEFMGTPSVANASANQWVELKYDVNALRVKFAGKDIKGLGFQFMPRTQTGTVEDGTDGVDFNFEIYSIEIAYASTLTGYDLFATNIDLASFGVDNFTQNHVIKNGDDVLEAGVDYSIDNGKLSIAHGTYTIETTVSGDDVAQRTFVRNYTRKSNQVTDINTTSVTSSGWGGTYYGGREVITLDAKPEGYNGTRTDLTAVKGYSGDHQLHVGLDVSTLTSNMATMSDDQYLSIWIKFEWKTTGSEAVAPKMGTTSVNLRSTAVIGNNTVSKSITSYTVSNQDINAGRWVNLCYTKSQLNVAGVASLKYLTITINEYFNDKGDPKTSIYATVYAVEVLSKSSVENTGVIEFFPNNIMAAGWHAPTYQSVAANSQHIASIEKPENYIGSRKENTALAVAGTDANCAFAFNISSFLANIDTLMDDNDYVSIWIKHEGSSWGLFSAKLWLKAVPNRGEGSTSTPGNTLVGDYRPSATALENVNKWIEIRLTKEQLKAAYTSEDKVWLMFEFNIGGGSAVCTTYIYDIAVVNVD